MKRLHYIFPNSDIVVTVEVGMLCDGGNGVWIHAERFKETTHPGIRL